MFFIFTKAISMKRTLKKCCLYLLGRTLYRRLFSNFRSKLVKSSDSDNVVPVDPDVFDDGLYDRFYCIMRKNGANSLGVLPPDK